MKKGSSKRIPILNQVVPQSWGTSNGTFVTNKVSDIEISFVEYSAIKKVRLQPVIVEYSPEDQAPMYDGPDCNARRGKILWRVKTPILVKSV
jgi:hypothetical protein